MRGCDTSLAGAHPVLAFKVVRTWTTAPEKGSHFWHSRGLQKPEDTGPAFPVLPSAPTFWAACTGATHLG